MKNLRKHIKRLLKESISEEVANLMQIYDSGREMQAMELAYTLGPEVSRHPDLKIWDVIERGAVVITGLNYDQAMDPKYHAFVAFSDLVDARQETLDDDDFEGVDRAMREGGIKAEVVRVNEEGFFVVIKVVEI